MSLEPRPEEVRLMLCEAQAGTLLKARLCTPPAHPRAVVLLLEALAAWYRQPLHAVLAADAPGVRSDPQRWALLLGEVAGPDVRVEWVARLAPRRRDRFLGELGDFSSARRLLHRAATGLS
jgi:hypothetical protein